MRPMKFTKNFARTIHHLFNNFPALPPVNWLICGLQGVRCWMRFSLPLHINLSSPGGMCLFTFLFAPGYCISVPDWFCMIKSSSTWTFQYKIQLNNVIIVGNSELRQESKALFWGRRMWGCWQPEIYNACGIGPQFVYNERGTLEL